MSKRFFWLLVMMAAVVACQEVEPTPQPTPRGLGGGVTAPEETQPDPTLSLSDTSGMAGATVLLSGRDFPEETFVEIRLSSSEGSQDAQSLATIQADDIGTFATSLTMPTLWPETLEAGQVTLQLTAETLTEPALTVSTAYDLSYDGAFRTYTNEVGGFAIDIPAEWTVGEAQSTPLGTMFLLGNEPLMPGDPAVSTILISDELTAARAAEQLLCGGGCVDDVRLQVVQDDAALTLYKKDIVSVGSPTLTWYFVERDGRLIYLTLHDPITYRSLDDLMDTLTFEAADQIAAVATEEPVVTEAAETTEDEPEVEEATATAPPTETASTSAVATEEAAVEETATIVSTPTNTAVPTGTATPTNTPTSTVIPSETPTPTATVNPFNEIEGAGPVETASAFMLAMIRRQVVTVGDASAIFTEELLEERPAQEALLTYMELDGLFNSFNLSRLQTTDVIVRATLSFADGSEVERFLSFELGEGEQWRISGISSGDTEGAEEAEEAEESSTPEGEGEGAGEVEEATPTPEGESEDGG